MLSDEVFHSLSETVVLPAPNPVELEAQEMGGPGDGDLPELILGVDLADDLLGVAMLMVILDCQRLGPAAAATVGTSASSARVLSSRGAALALLVSSMS